MHVAIDAMLLRPPHTGVQRYISGLIRALVAHVPGIELTVYIGRGHGWDTDLEGSVDFRRALVRSSIRPLRICWEQTVLPFSLRRSKAQLLHAPGYVMPVLGTVVSRKPVVLTVHDVTALDRPELASSLNAFHYGLLMPISVRLASCVIVPTRAVEALPRRVEVVPWGIEERFFRGGRSEGDADILKGLGVEEPFVLHVGRTDPKKNIEQLIKAFFAMRMDTSSPHRLVLAGAPGRSHKHIRRLVANLRMDEYVVFTGHVSDEGLEVLYRRAELVVCASTDEGFGFPALEALASGSAVAVSRIPAFSEVLGDDVPMFDPEDLPGLRKMMTHLLRDDSARREVAERGKKLVEQYTWEKCARRTFGVYLRSLTG
jgi:glycosyltransferase involved in cell wall biosynthesis